MGCFLAFFPLYFNKVVEYLQSILTFYIFVVNNLKVIAYGKLKRSN